MVDAHGLEVRVVSAVHGPEDGGETLDVSLVGQDRPGIVDQVTAVLSGLDANIETFKTWIDSGSHSGVPLFHAAARVRLPPELSAAAVQSALEEISAEIMVDIAVAPAA
jgi:glycine cleavage system regulatory protein